MTHYKDRTISGNKIGGLKAAATNKAKHGDDFYKRIGGVGGKALGPKGFAVTKPCNCELFTVTHTIARCAGVKGGMKSRRPSKKG